LVKKCVDDIYESSLKWAYEAESEDDMPIDEIKLAVLNAHVPLDFETVMKHYYMWKEMMKDGICHFRHVNESIECKMLIGM
jgi:hypothetical protein